jgi:hypothetical protein
VVAILVPLQESSLALVGTLLIVTGSPATAEESLGAAEAEALAAQSVSAATPPSAGQSLSTQRDNDDSGTAGDEPPAQSEATAPVREAPWKRYILRTDEAIERFDRDKPVLFPPQRHDAPETTPAPGHGDISVPARPETPAEANTAARASRYLEAIDTAIGRLHDHVLAAFDGGTPTVSESHQKQNGMRIGLEGFTQPKVTGLAKRYDLAAALAFAATVAAGSYFATANRCARLRGRIVKAWPPVDHDREPGN